MSHTTSAAGRAEVMRELKLRRGRRQAARTASVWGPDGKRVPAAFVDLRDRTPEEKRTFLHGMAVRAEREETGKAAGDLASTVVATPAMQRVMEEEAQRGRTSS